jgi:hypothetical protein
MLKSNESKQAMYMNIYIYIFRQVICVSSCRGIFYYCLGVRLSYVRSSDEMISA